MNTERFVIAAYVDGQIEVWQGHYGWMPVPENKPQRIGGGYHYSTRAKAETALRRMKAKHPHRRNTSTAKIYELSEVWDANDNFRWELFRDTQSN